MRRLAGFLALCASSMFALSGCSFAFVSGPPANHAQLAYFDCTSSRLAPVLDSVLTGLMILDEISLGASSDQQWADANSCKAGDANCPAISRHGAMAFDAVLGVAGAAGLIYGFSRTSACRQAKAEQQLRGTQQQPYVPGSWPPPSYPQPGAPPPAPQPEPAPQ